MHMECRKITKQKQNEITCQFDVYFFSLAIITFSIQCINIHILTWFERKQSNAAQRTQKNRGQKNTALRSFAVQCIVMLALQFNGTRAGQAVIDWWTIQIVCTMYKLLSFFITSIYFKVYVLPFSPHPFYLSRFRFLPFRSAWIIFVVISFHIIFQFTRRVYLVWALPVWKKNRARSINFPIFFITQATKSCLYVYDIEYDFLD